MKRKFALLGAVVSGGYLLTLGILPDPIPFIDEGLMLVVFAKSMAALGFDVGKLLPFLGRGKNPATARPAGPAARPAARKREGPIVDI